MKAENELILLGVKIRKDENESKRFDELIREELDWAYITGELIRHRIHGYFYSNLSTDQKKYLFPKIKVTFDLLCNIYGLCNKTGLEFFEQLVDETEAEGIVIAGLKGVVFNSSIYGLKERRSNDLDVLVAEEDLKTFDKVMKKMGFIQSNDGGKTEATRKDKLIQRMNYHDLVPYYKNIGLPYMNWLKVDVNFHFDSKEHDITRAILNEGTTDYCNNGYKIKGLKWTSHLMHLCIHFYREASNSIWTSNARDLDLYKLVDIENSFSQFTPEQLYEWCEKVKMYELERPCYFALYYLNLFYPKKLYEELLEKIKPQDVSYLSDISVKGGHNEKRKKDFFEQTFNMTCSKNYVDKDFSRAE